MESALTKATRRALRAAPCSLRALAREARVVHTTLAEIDRGELGASPAVARAVAKALLRWGTRCQKAAKGLEAALRSHPR